MKIKTIPNYKRTEGVTVSRNSPHRRVVVTMRPETLRAIRDRAERRNVSFSNESRRLIDNGFAARGFRCCPFCGSEDHLHLSEDGTSMKCTGLRCNTIMPAEWFA